MTTQLEKLLGQEMNIMDNVTEQLNSISDHAYSKVSLLLHTATFNKNKTEKYREQVINDIDERNQKLEKAGLRGVAFSLTKGKKRKTSGVYTKKDQKHIDKIRSLLWAEFFVVADIILELEDMSVSEYSQYAQLLQTITYNKSKKLRNKSAMIKELDKQNRNLEQVESEVSYMRMW